MEGVHTGVKVNPDEAPRLRIGELGARTGVPTHRLRHYEDRGLLESRRDVNGYRYFEESAVVTVARIVTLLHAGLNVEEVSEVLPRLDGSSGPGVLDPEAHSVLQARSVLLDAQINCLATAKRALDRILADGGEVKPLDEYEPCALSRKPLFNLAARPAPGAVRVADATRRA